MVDHGSIVPKDGERYRKGAEARPRADYYRAKQAATEVAWNPPAEPPAGPGANRIR